MLKQLNWRRVAAAFALSGTTISLGVLGACSVSPPGGPYSRDTHDGTGTPPALAKPAVVLHPNPAFASLPRYEGVLGKRQIVLRLGEKTDPGDAGGLHGEYQFADSGQVMLVAGDADGGVV